MKTLLTTPFLALSIAVQAQTHDHQAGDDRPVTLLPGMGTLHRAIQTSNADAQKFFDQGLTFVFAFNHDEAVRSFQKAAELDPRSPMPHWGVALALGPNINLDVDPARELAAYEAAQRASPRGGRARARARVRGSHPDALLERSEGRPEGARRPLQGGDAHTVGSLSGRPRCGNALTANVVATEVDRKYIEATNATGFYPTMYYNHNLDFLASAAMMTGQFAEASKAAKEVVTNVSPMLGDMAMLEPFAAKQLYVLLRFAKWNDVLQLPQPDTKSQLLTALYHFGRGVAHAALGASAEAADDRAAYQTARRAVPDDTPWLYNTAGAIFAVSDAVLDARMLAASGRHAEAIAAWQRRSPPRIS